MAQAPTAGVNGSILAGVLRFRCSLDMRWNPMVETDRQKTWKEIGEFAFEMMAVTILQRLPLVGTAGIADALSEDVDIHATGFVRLSARRDRTFYNILR